MHNEHDVSTPRRIYCGKVIVFDKLCSTGILAGKNLHLQE